MLIHFSCNVHLFSDQCKIPFFWFPHFGKKYSGTMKLFNPVHAGCKVKVHASDGIRSGIYIQTGKRFWSKTFESYACRHSKEYKRNKGKMFGNSTPFVHELSGCFVCKEDAHAQMFLHFNRNFSYYT
jgi:hypothetical protein